MCSTFLLSPNALQIQIRCSRNLLLLPGVHVRNGSLWKPRKPNRCRRSLVFTPGADEIQLEQFQKCLFPKTYAFYSDVNKPADFPCTIFRVGPRVCTRRVDTVEMEFRSKGARSISENKNVGLTSMSKDRKKNIDLQTLNMRTDIGLKQ